MSEERLTIEVAVDGEEDWQPFAWVERQAAEGNAVCGRCALPVFSIGAPEPGYWAWEGVGLARCAALCVRCVGVPVRAPGKANGRWQGPS